MPECYVDLLQALLGVGIDPTWKNLDAMLRQLNDMMIPGPIGADR